MKEEHKTQKRWGYNRNTNYGRKPSKYRYGYSDSGHSYKDSSDRHSGKGHKYCKDRSDRDRKDGTVPLEETHNVCAFQPYLYLLTISDTNWVPARHVRGE